MRLFRSVIGVLLLISGVTHITQLWVYPTDATAKLAAAFGVLYLVIGLWLLLSRTSLAVWASTVFPTIGGILGIIRFVSFHANPFTEFHLLVDVIVVALSVFLLVTHRATVPARASASAAR